MRALLLAAGEGKRLRPLTLTTPKPCLPVQGVPMAVRQILALKAAGITEIVINVGHLARVVFETLGDGSRWGVTLHYSIEGPSLDEASIETALETRGGIVKAMPQLSPHGEPFLVVAGDIVTDYPFERLVQHASEQGDKLGAHLVLVPNPSFHEQGDFGLVEGRIVKTPKTYTFSSLGVYHPRLFQGLAPEFAKLFPWLLDTYPEAMTGEVFTGQWFNVGDALSLAQANEHFVPPASQQGAL